MSDDKIHSDNSKKPDNNGTESSRARARRKLLITGGVVTGISQMPSKWTLL